MRKFLICLLLLSFCGGDNSEEMLINESFKFTQIFVFDNEGFITGEVGQVKVFDSEGNLIAFEKDYQSSSQQILSLGSQELEITVRTFEVEIVQDLSNFLYLQINTNEYDKDDIQELISSKCNILTSSVYSRNDTFKQFINEVYDAYCVNN